MKEPNGNITSYTYDALNRLIQKVEPLGGTYQYSYDAVGNMMSLTDPKGNTITYTYDANDRLTQVQYPDNSSVTFTYDANGNRSSMVDQVGTSAYSYDILNRMTVYTDPFGKTVGYEYDANGNRSSVTYPDGKKVSYTYDAMNRLVTVTDWLIREAIYTYDAAGNLVQAINPNNTRVTYAYDAAERLTGLSNSKSDASVISSYSYTLDPIGNHTSVTRNEPLVPSFSSQNIGYSYDSENRLIKAGGATYSYDANGNLTGRGSDTFTYDYKNRLSESNIGGTATQYIYDGLGNRLGKNVDGATTRYVLDINGTLSNILADTNGTGTITAYYVYGLGLCSKILPDGTACYYHYDSRGSTVALTDTSQSITDGYAYDSFGSVANSTGTTQNPFKYIGRYGVMSDGNGFNYIRSRYYAPEIGRFITKDLKTGNDKDSQSLNRYIYALNNPVILIDISGFSAQEGEAYINLTKSSDSLHNGLVDRIKQIQMQALMAELDHVAALEIEAAYWDAWVNTLEGVKGALGTAGGLFTGGPLGAVSGILNQLSTLSDVAGGPTWVTKTLKTSSNVVGIGTSVYGGYKDISNIRKLGGISRTGQLTLGTALYQKPLTKAKLIYGGFQIGRKFVDLLNAW